MFFLLFICGVKSFFMCLLFDFTFFGMNMESMSSAALFDWDVVRVCDICFVVWFDLKILLYVCCIGVFEFFVGDGVLKFVVELFIRTFIFASSIVNDGMRIKSSMNVLLFLLLFVIWFWLLLLLKRFIWLNEGFLFGWICDFFIRF